MKKTIIEKLIEAQKNNPDLVGLPIKKYKIDETELKELIDIIKEPIIENKKEIIREL